MRQYLCLGYFHKEKMGALPNEEIDALMQQCQPHMETIRRSGRVIVDAGLETEGKYLRRVNGAVVVTDGPFIETKEVVGGAFLIEAENMDEAVAIASLHPTTQMAAGEEYGWRLEIRPIHSFAMREPKEK